MIPDGGTPPHSIQHPYRLGDTGEGVPTRRQALRRASIVLALIVAAVSATWLYGEQRVSRREISVLVNDLAVERARREALEREVAEAAERLVAYRQTSEALGEVHRDQLNWIEHTVRALETERDASERIIATYGPGVALIQGVIAYDDAAGRPLRYASVDARGRPARGPLGAPRMSADGRGPLVRTTFLGTGFLVSRDGAFLTSRHVTRPWAADPTLATYLEQEGVEPKVAQLRAFFPGSPEPVSLRVEKASATADLIVLRATVPPRSAPALPLDLGGGDAVPGRPVVLLGYPGGLELLLARVRPALLDTLIDPSVAEINDVSVDVPTLLERLSRLGEIRPYPTWGRLTDKRPFQLAHDAETGIGGSGGPIFATSGRVIGLTTAVVRDFDSAALGVPIREAMVPLARARRSASQDPVRRQ